jgi:3'-phosphoadenosine 5'-phosphosulfate sulfotransferase (PAPS reductase)/FAD synthetase
MNKQEALAILASMVEPQKKPRRSSGMTKQQALAELAAMVSPSPAVPSRPSASTVNPLEAFDALYAKWVGAPPKKVKRGSSRVWRETMDDISPKAARALWSFVPDLQWYDYIMLNTSGGKDSMAMIHRVLPLCEAAGVLDRVWLVHADLGRAEHPGTLELVKQHADALEVALQVIDTETTRGRSLIDRFESRLQQGGGFPGFGTRYCTSEYKTSEVTKFMTKLIRQDLGGLPMKTLGRRARFLNVLGLRAEESKQRRGPPLVLRNETATTRIEHTWLPIQGWSEREVWEAVKESGLRPHPFYGFNPKTMKAQKGRRLSCRFCPLAGDEDLRLAGSMYPQLAQEYIALQQKYDTPFKQKKTLRQILQKK